MTHPRYNGRAQRVRDYLATHPNGATARELIIACEPGCHPNNMAATIAGLVNSKKLHVDKSGPVARYYATAQVHVDGRIATNAAGKRRKHPKLRAPATTAPKRRSTERLPRIPKAKRPANAPPADTRAPLQRFAATRSPQLQRPPAAAESVDEFLARGGHIDRLPVGAVSQPLKYDHRAANEASWQARLRRLADAEN